MTLDQQEDPMQRKGFASDDVSQPGKCECGCNYPDHFRRPHPATHIPDCPVCRVLREHLLLTTNNLSTELQNLIDMKSRAESAEKLRDEHFAELQRARVIIGNLTPTWHTASSLLPVEALPDKDNVPFAIRELKIRVERAEQRTAKLAAWWDEYKDFELVECGALDDLRAAIEAALRIGRQS